jgi:formiminotetrahydrofolate cyclodeaminase
VRDARLGSDLALAAYTPLSIAEVSADAAELAALLAQGAHPDVRADAVVAACLAEGASRARRLVPINLGMAADEDRIDTAQDYAECAAAARARALGQTAGD